MLSFLSVCRPVMAVVGKRLVNGWLEATDVLDRHVFRVRAARPNVLVESGENLRVQDLKPPDSIHHPLQLLAREKKRLLSGVPRLRE